jgi:hypothetical protein
MRNLILHPAVYWPLLAALIIAFCWFIQSPSDPLN